MELEKFVHCCRVFWESISVGAGKAGAVCSTVGLSVNSGPGRETWQSLPPHSLGTITRDLSCPGGTWPDVTTPKMASGSIHTLRVQAAAESGSWVWVSIQERGCKEPWFCLKNIQGILTPWAALLAFYCWWKSLALPCTDLCIEWGGTGVKPGDGPGFTITQNQRD